jgi:hypothetical protein
VEKCEKQIMWEKYEKPLNYAEKCEKVIKLCGENVKNKICGKM